MPTTPLSEQTAEALSRLYALAEERMARALTDALAGAQTAKAGRIRELQRMVSDEVAALESASREWIARDLPAVYHAGAVAAAETVGSSTAPFALLHRDAMQALAEQTWSDVLRSTRFLTRDTKATIRKLAEDQAARVLLGEATASKAGADLAAAVRESTDLLTIRYRNGSRHAISSWSDTLARTSTALSYQEGTLVQCEADGFEFLELFDGPGCCVGPGHDVGPFANGLVLTVAEVRANPIAHPRCARSASPRPDIASTAAAKNARRFTDAEQETMAAAERARAQVANVNTTKGFFSREREASRTGRRAREPRTARVPRS